MLRPETNRIETKYQVYMHHLSRGIEHRQRRASCAGGSDVKRVGGDTSLSFKRELYSFVLSDEDRTTLLKARIQGL